MKGLLVPLLAGLAGCAVLAFLFPRVHPATGWDYHFGRGEAIQHARGLAASQSVDTAAWAVYVSASYSRRVEYYLRLHPDDRIARQISPSSVKVMFRSPDKTRSMSVELNPSGKITGWARKEPRDAQPPTPQELAAARAVADAAFQIIAGSEAASYRLATAGASTKAGSRFTWERSTAANTFQPTVNIVVRDGAALHAQTQVVYAKDFDAEYSRLRDAASLWGVAHALIYFVIVLAAAVLFAMGSVRKRVDHRFAIAYGLATLVFAAAALLFGPDLEEAHIAGVSDNQEAILEFGVLALLCLATSLFAWAAAGAGWFAAGPLRSKWWTLRLLLSRRMLSRPVGRSICAGMLWAPALAAAPVIVAALFPNAQWVHRDAGELFCRLPLLQVLRHPLQPGLLGFFGILFMLAVTRIPWLWLRWIAMAAAGTAFFTGYENQFQNSATASVFEGVLILAGYFSLFRRFDLLAVIVSGTGKGILLAAPILIWQPAASLRNIGWRMLAVAVAALGAGLVLLWKAPEMKDEEAGSPTPDEGVRSQHEELKSEFLIAQRAQREMLPANPPDIAGFKIAAHCTPAREVGGDLYDFLPLANGRVAIAVADVSGKGVPAALYMTLTKGLLAATTQEDLELPLIMEHINGHLYTVGGRKTFVTMALGILDPESRTLEYARAGHNPAVWRRPRAGSTSFLSSAGIGLGIASGPLFCRTLAVDTLNLESGDTLVFYSDGLTEAMNPAQEQFGDERLACVVETLDGLTASGARDAILAEVTRFLEGNHPQDDLTLVVLRVE